MQIYIKGQLKNVFKAKDFKNKDGEVESKGKWQLQFEDKIEGQDGFQIVIHKVSIPDDKVEQYRSKIDEEVVVPVRAFSSKGKVIYYGV
jgi:hypothetical protein